MRAGVKEIDANTQIVTQFLVILATLLHVTPPFISHFYQ